MKEEILKQFTEKLMHYANNAELFASKNVPAYIEELLKFKMYDHIAMAFVLTTIFVVTLAFTVIVIMRARKLKDQDHAFVISFIPSLITLIMFIVFSTKGYLHIREAVKIKMAPRVYVIDYLRGNK